MEKISVVIPCYNSSKSIENVVRRVKSTIEDKNNYEYEIICVNDYSPDNTLSVLIELANNDEHIKVISLSKNFGQHAALMAGFKYVTGDLVLCLDDDGETPPENMFMLIDKLNEGFDLVSAKYAKKGRSFIRTWGSRFSMYMSEKLVNVPKDIELNSFYVFRRYIVDEILKYENPYPFVHGLITQITHNMANVEMKREKRISGKSGYSLRRLTSLFINGFTTFSAKPLWFAIYIGILSAIFGFATGIYIVVRKIINPEILAGYTSIMAVVFFLFGILMCFLGLLGEYVGRIYISINNIPQYVVKQKINVNDCEEKNEKSTNS